MLRLEGDSMILIPEQIQYLKDTISELKIQIKDYQNYILERKFGDGEGSSIIYHGDVVTESQLEEKQKKLKTYQNMLESSMYLTEIPTNKIGIGSKFQIQFDDCNQIEEYVLVETLIGNHMADSAITIESPLGQSLLGKQDGDKFYYKIGDTSTPQMIAGTVIKINKDIVNSNPYIRKKDRSHRKSESTTYSESSVITPSQKKLIMAEIDDLRKQPLSTLHDKIVVNRRLSNLKRILESSKLAILPEDETIGIGTSFSIMIFDKDKTYFKRFEMIDQAISNEREDEYIERISPLGNAVFGLKNQEEFIVQTRDFHFVSGIVFDISNHKECMQTNNPTIYQKSKSLVI